MGKVQLWTFFILTSTEKLKLFVSGLRILLIIHFAVWFLHWWVKAGILFNVLILHNISWFSYTSVTHTIRSVFIVEVRFQHLMSLSWKDSACGLLSKQFATGIWICGGESSAFWRGAFSCVLTFLTCTSEWIVTRSRQSCIALDIFALVTRDASMFCIILFRSYHSAADVFLTCFREAKSLWKILIIKHALQFFTCSICWLQHNTS